MSQSSPTVAPALREQVIAAFREQFDAEPASLVRAPGRVNLIGEHTDYNGGFVLPLAIDRAVWIALRPRADDTVTAWSLDFSELRSFSAGEPDRGDPAWIEYLKGVAWALRDEGFQLRGWEGVVGGDVPVGAGLSSSAALELATARAFAAVSDLPWDARRMALVGQKAENQWVGVNCGIMDQLISAAGQAGHALLIDCLSLETTPVPLPAGASVIVMDTSTRRGLESSAYNERRSQCEAAARHYGVAFLRELAVEDFAAREHELDATTRRRARHVVTENARTLEAADALRAGDARRLGHLMDASHASLRDDFEVSSRELNLLVDLARSEDGCHGARMTGAGFGGCAVALVATAAARDFARAVSRQYNERCGLKPAIYICQAMDGASVIDLAVAC